MKFSEHFGINADQSALDFVDIDLDTDFELFIDPYAISTRSDDWSISCAISVNSFFQTSITAIRNQDRNRALELLNELHEPNETHLGLSSGKPSGRGVGGMQAAQLLDALERSTAVRTGFIEDLADCELLVDGIGADKISDITTNLIRAQLIGYTQEQCALHNIATQNVAAGAVWLSDESRWEVRFAELPVVNSARVLLVPKFAVRWNVLLNHTEYYRHYVLNFLQQLHSGSGGLPHLARRHGRITKTALAEEFPISKAFLLNFSQEHPEVLRRYKTAKAGVAPLTDEEFEGSFDRFEMADFFKRELAATSPGRPHESRFQRLIVGLISFLFYPNLITPRLEERINDDRKRIDITYVNGARSGLFARFTNTHRRQSGKIIVECKNYSNDPGNDEVNQVLGYFADHRGWLGFLICRTLNDPDELAARCRDLARDHRAFIVPLSDADLIAMLDACQRDGTLGVDQYLSNRFNELTR